MGLFSVLTNLGEKMSDEEVDELLKAGHEAVDYDTGNVNYERMFGSIIPTLDYCY